MNMSPGMVHPRAAPPAEPPSLAAHMQMVVMTVHHAAACRQASRPARRGKTIHNPVEYSDPHPSMHSLYPSHLCTRRGVNDECIQGREGLPWRKRWPRWLIMERVSIHAMWRASQAAFRPWTGPGCLHLPISAIDPMQKVGAPLEARLAHPNHAGVGIGRHPGHLSAQQCCCCWSSIFLALTSRAGGEAQQQCMCGSAKHHSALCSWQQPSMRCHAWQHQPQQCRGSDNPAGSRAA